MKYGIRKNWLSTLEIMTKNPVIILPFIFIAFFECLVLEIVYFSARNPVAVVVGPIVRKFFGEGFLHYPSNLALLPKLFYYGQVVIYVFIGVFLTAISVNIFRNVREGLPVTAKAMVRNALKRYLAFFVYGIVGIVLLTLTQKFGSFVFAKFARLLARSFPNLPLALYSGLFSTGHLLANIILQVFVVLTIPIIVIEKRPFLAAFFRSITTGFRNFFKIFLLIALPYLLYLPIITLRGDPARLIGNTFPEVTAIVTLIGIMAAPILDCFIIICASQFLIDKLKAPEKTT